MKSLWRFGMVSVELKEKVQVVEDPSQELNSTALQQVRDILEESEKAREPQEPKTTYWSYSVPFAGVRYYSY
jgi:hypothetical protein